MEEVSEAHTTKFSLFEEQGLYYFAGYMVKKLLNFHASSCNVCKKFSRKVPTSTDHLHEREFFIFLKRYDDDLCTLHSASVEFVSYVYDICHLVNFCFEKYVESALVLQSMISAVSVHVTSPRFCCKEMKEGTSSLIVRTLFHYKVKWLNDRIRGGEESSNRKLQILKHN